MKKFTLTLKKSVFFLFAAAFLLFSGFAAPLDHRGFIHDFLNNYYDKDEQLRTLKQYEIKVTNTGFCRYRKVYANGKEEFFSFSLSRFKSVDFLGNTLRGELVLHTKNDDVIVQTRNDKAGAIDSMATYMVVPLKNIDAEQLNELHYHLKEITNKALATGK